MDGNSKFFSLTDLGNIKVGSSEIIIKSKGGWKWRDREDLNLPSLIWEVLKYLYPRSENKGEIMEVAKKVFPGKFKCTGCGECCRHISNLLPQFDLGDGVCCHLGENNLCDIYDERPLICRVEDFWSRCLEGKVSKEDWYRINYDGCKKLQDED